MNFNSTVKVAMLGISVVAGSSSFNQQRAYEQVATLKSAIDQYEETLQNYQTMQTNLLELVKAQSQCIQDLKGKYKNEEMGNQEEQVDEQKADNKTTSSAVGVVIE